MGSPTHHQYDESDYPTRLDLTVAYILDRKEIIEKELKEIKEQYGPLHEEYLRSRRNRESIVREINRLEYELGTLEIILEDNENYVHTSTTRPGSYSPSQVALPATEASQPQP